MLLRTGLIFLLAAMFISQVFADGPLSKRDIARLHVKRWELVEVRLGANQIISARDVSGANGLATIDFRVNGDFSGGDGCNSFTGKYAINGSMKELHISDISFTSLACLPEYKINTYTFVEMLKDNRIELNGSELKLSSITGERVLVYKAIHRAAIVE